MSTIADARNQLERQIVEELLPRLSDFRHKKPGTLWRTASAIHLERVTLGVRRSGEHFKVQLSAGVRYPAFEWLRFQGKPPKGSGLGYNIGLKHHAPGQEWWNLEDPELMREVYTDIDKHAFALFEALSTPDDIIADLLTVPTERMDFVAGGPDDRAIKVAAMMYAYGDSTEATTLLEAVLRTGKMAEYSLVRPHVVEAFLAFLRKEPQVPRLPLRP